MNLTLWSDMFTLAIPVLEKILRPIFIYAALIVGLRLAGKRELAQLNPFDLVVLLTLSNTVQNAIIGDDNSVTGGLIGAATLLALNYAVARLASRHTNVERLVEGREDLLVENGQVKENSLVNNALSQVDLEVAAHEQGYSSLEEVKRAVLEPTGKIAFFPKQPAPEAARHQELLARIDALTQKIAELQALVEKQ